jgi:hypothetical protein
VSGLPEPPELSPEKAKRLADAFLDGMIDDLQDKDRRSAHLLGEARRFLKENKIEVPLMRRAHLTKLTEEAPWETDDEADVG